MNDERRCPLCGRAMPEGTYNAHHLIPATFKGTELIDLHYICHNAIHMNISNRELKNHYNTMEKILEHSDIQTFIKWVSKKPPEFYVGFKLKK